MKQCPICNGVLQEGYLHATRSPGLAFVLDTDFHRSTTWAFTKAGFQKKNPEAVLLDGPHAIRPVVMPAIIYVPAQNCQACQKIFVSY